MFLELPGLHLEVIIGILKVEHCLERTKTPVYPEMKADWAVRTQEFDASKSCQELDSIKRAGLGILYRNKTSKQTGL